MVAVMDRHGMRSLRAWRGPAFVMVLMLVPVAFLTWMLVAEKDRSIAVAQQELRGLEYLLPVVHAARLAALHRGLTYGYQNGNHALLPQIRQTEAQMDGALDELEVAQTRYGAPLHLSPIHHPARDLWLQLKR